MNRIDQDTYELSTGRRIGAFAGVLGLQPDPTESHFSRLVEGYHDPIDCGREKNSDDFDHGGEPPLTPAERREIAEYQIKLWAEWGGVTQ